MYDTKRSSGQYPLFLIVGMMQAKEVEMRCDDWTLSKQGEWGALWGNKANWLPGELYVLTLCYLHEGRQHCHKHWNGAHHRTDICPISLEQGVELRTLPALRIRHTLKNMTVQHFDTA